ASRTWPWRAARMHRSWPRRWRKRAACSRKRWHDATRPRRSRRGHGPRPGAGVKALVLAGGRGTRLRPITHTSAKQLVPIANKPILQYPMESVVAAGILDIGMIVGDTEAEIRAAVGDGSRWGARVTYIRQSAPLGLAHAVKEAQAYLDGSPFVMYLGDNLVPEGIKGFVDQFEKGRPDALILLSRVHAPERFGVAELRDGQVIGLEEKPQTPKSDLALVGVYLFTSRVFDAVHAISPSARG